MTFDMNDAEQQRSSELIPDGSFARVMMIIRPGGIDGDGEFDQGLLRASKNPTSDVRMLDCEFTVLQGPHTRRKFWQMFTVQGGKRDENGVSIAWKISKGVFRAMIDSALGLDPRDNGEDAKHKRVLRGLCDLSEIQFIAKIKVEPSDDSRYGDQNRLDHVVVPTEKEWKLIMDGQDVPPSPSRPRGAAGKKAPAQQIWMLKSPQPSPAQPSPAPQQTGAKPWSKPAEAAPAVNAAGPDWLNG